jgi:hypothetical protein
MGLKLMAELGLDGSGFASGLKRAEGLAHSAGHGIREALVGMVGVGTIGLAIHKTVESAHELVDASERLGIGVTNLQVLRKAAIDAGAEFGKLEKSFERIDVARRKALTPGAEGSDMRRTFARMGISPDMLRSMTASQLFMGPMAQTARSMGQGQFGPLLQELGIRDFGAMIPVLKTNFEELEASMKKYGGIMDAETAVKLKHLSEEFSLLSNVITAHLGPAMVKLAEWIYANILSAGKGVAGASAALGAGTAKMGLGEMLWASLKAAGYGLNAAGARALGAPESQTTAWLKAKMAGAGFDVGAMGGASAAAQRPWADRQKAFAAALAKFAELGGHLDNPAGGPYSGDSMKRSVKSLEVPSDSLTRVGNFLGGSQTAIMRLAQQRTQYLRQIAQNTAHLAPGRGAGHVLGASMGGMNTVFVPTF